MLDSKIGKEGEDLVRDVLEDMRKYGKSSVLAEKRNEVLATIACHSAIRVNRLLTLSGNGCRFKRHGKKLIVQTNAIMGVQPGFRISHRELDGFFMRGK